jgi:anaerobic magnesium-protoporphyrin IX monomethyl ester cyclase
MKVLLVNASVTRGMAYGLDDGMPRGLMRYLGGYQPLGVCYLAGVLLQNGYSDVELIDAEAEDLPVDDAARRVLGARPDMVGISCVSFSYLYALDLARLIKQAADLPIVIGGPHVDIYPREVMTHSCFDVGVVGEGEHTFLELVRLLSAVPRTRWPEELAKLPGVVCRVDGQPVVNGQRPVVHDLDALPYPARHLLQVKLYEQNYLPNPFISLLSARGCPFQCSYCYRPAWTRRLRAHSPLYVVNEIEHCMRQFGASSFQFFDDTFTVDRRRVLEICRLIRERGLKIRFLCLTRVDCLDREIVAALAGAGCSCISFGVESGDAGILAAMNKRFKPEDVERAFALCREHGIDIVAYYLLGHPQETKESIQRTIASIRATRPSWFKANIMRPYPASQLYEELLREGRIEDDWRQLTLEGRPFSPPHICKELTHQQLERYRVRINLMPYLRWNSNLLNWRRLSNPQNVLWSLRWLVQGLEDYLWRR